MELDRGEGIPWKGNYTEWLDQKSKRLAQEEKTESKRKKILERELEWIRMNPKGRHAKSKSRIANYEKMLTEDRKDKEEKLEIYIPPGPRLGNEVIEAEHVSKAFGDKLLYDDLNFKLPPAGIVGIIGPNGAGKTTIFTMILGEIKPDSGTFKIGSTVTHPCPLRRRWGKPWGRSSRLLKDSFHDSEGHCRLNQTGLYGRAHLEPPFDSSVLVKAQVRRVSLLEQVALGASQTTMQRCLTARPDSRLPSIRDQDEGWPKGFSILPGGDGD